MRVSALIVGLVFLVGSSIAVSGAFESLKAIPAGWKQLGAPSPDARIHLRIALKKPNLDLFEKTLFAVSSPDHPEYGHHLNRDELKAMLKPTAESTNAVLSWLAESGVSPFDIEDDGDWIHFFVSVGTANSMMSTTFQIYGNSIDNSEKIRTLRYSVPAAVAEHITMIQPTYGTHQERTYLANTHTGPALGKSGHRSPKCLRYLQGRQLIRL
jgi:tripeptidyl-peptidase-1